MPDLRFPLAAAADRQGATSPRHRARLRWVVATSLGFGLVSCNGSSSDANGKGSSTADEPAVVATVATTVPSAFCAAIDTLEPFRQDVTTEYGVQAEQIAAVYESLLNDLPDTIRPDFEAVIATLRAGTGQSASASQVDAAESGNDAVTIADITGYAIDSTPAERVNNYITYTCTGVGNNPNPPATIPPQVTSPP